MRPRVVLILAAAVLVLTGVLLIPTASARLTGTSGADASAPATIAPPAPAPLTLAAGPVDVQIDGFLSWALLDRATGNITGSDNVTATNSAESMIKIWFAADVLRLATESGAEPDQVLLDAASAAIRDSDDPATNMLYRLAGGPASLRRMIEMCGLTETRPVIPPDATVVWWSYTEISARDAVRLGECVADGTAAGPRWTQWVLDEMAQVRGTTARQDQLPTRGGGRWGIIDGLPDEIVENGSVGMKNGWTLIHADGLWHLNCLATADEWVLAVLMRYPGGHGLDYGANVCRNVTSQLVVPAPGAALKIPQPLVEG
ncbi:serine hydrolase [Polymorphospora sp. NPDC051019]|uniref:serine hydrolase n=1 Tax=Polymorphospora sp. NPDC051019 TaxID=3155725 RepID=UPI00343DEC87